MLISISRALLCLLLSVSNSNKYLISDFMIPFFKVAMIMKLFKKIYKKRATNLPLP